MSARASRSSAATAAAAAPAVTPGKQTRGAAAAGAAGSHKKAAAAPRAAAAAAVPSPSPASSSASAAAAHTPGRRERAAFAATIAAVAASPAVAATVAAATAAAKPSSGRGAAAALPARSPVKGSRLVMGPDDVDEDGDEPMAASSSSKAAATSAVKPASSSSRKSTSKHSSFAAAATPATGKSAALKRLAATMAKAAAAAAGPDANRCTECAGLRSARGDCINPLCSSNPAFMPPFKRGHDGQWRCTAFPCCWVPLPSGPNGELECHGPRCDSDSAKRRREREAKAEAEERRRNPPPPPPAPVVKTPKPKTAAAASARSTKAAASSSSSESDSDDSSVKPTTSKRGRARKQIAAYLDPDDRDNSDDGDFVGGGRGSKAKQKAGSSSAAAAASPSKPKPPPPPPKVDVRDTDFSRAIAASLAVAAPEDVAFVAGVRTITTPASLYDERLLTDPRHRETMVTATYVVHPEHAVPKGYRGIEEARAAEQAAVSEAMDDVQEEEKQSSRRASKSAAAAAAPAAPPMALPILLPSSGFASATASESARELQSRSAAFDAVWCSIDRALHASIAQQEAEVFRSIVQFATESFTDFGPGDSGGASGNTAAAGAAAHASSLDLSKASYNYLATHYVHPAADADSPASAAASSRLPSSHALPVALVHASTNHEDHPLLMAGLKQTIDSIELARRSAERASRRSRRSRKAAEHESFLAKKQAHFHRGLRDAKNLGAQMSDEDDEDDDSAEGEDDDAAAETDGAAAGAQANQPAQAQFAPFPTPLPFVVTLPSTPASLSALFHALHSSLLSSYPSPRSLSSGAAMAAAVKGSKRDEKKKEDVEFVIAALAQWMQEHRAEQKLKYEQWKTRRDKWRATQNGETGPAAPEQQLQIEVEDDGAPVPMELDGESSSDAEEEERKSNSRKKQKTSAAKSAPASKKSKLAASSSSTAAASTPAASAAPLPFPSHVPSPPSGVSSGPSERTPSSIYPRLLLLFPSFCTFPRALLLDFLTLLTEHPILSNWDDIFPFVLVWPLSGGGSSGGGDAVRALIGGELTRRLWPGVFRLPSASAIMASLVARLFQHRGTASTGAGDADDESSGSASLLQQRSSPGGELCCPFTLGSGPMRFLLESFRDEHTSVGRSLAVIKYALLDLMDAQGAEYWQRDQLRLQANGATLVPSASSSSSSASAAASSSDATPLPLAAVGPAMSCSLSGSFLRAWMRQLSRAARIAHLASSAGARSRAGTAGIDVALLLKRADPIQLWAEGLSLPQLREMAALPSMAPLALGSLSESDGSASRLRSRIPQLVLELDAHRLGLFAAAGILLQLCQAVGFFGGVQALAVTAGKENAKGAQVTEAEESGISEQTQLWMHVLSHPVFLPAPSASTVATAPILRLHPASVPLFSRSSAGARNALTGLRVPASLDALLLASEHPDALRKLLDSGLARQVSLMESQRNALRKRDAAARSDGSDSPAVRTLSAAIAQWKEQLELLRSPVAEEKTTAAPSAAAAAPPAARAPTGPSSRTAKLHAASGITAALSRGQRASSAAMVALHRFCASLLRPLCAVPLGELVTYDRPFRLRAAFAPQQEAAVYRALVSPEMYLGQGIDLNVPAHLRRPAVSSPSAAAAASPSSLFVPSSRSLISSASPDISVAFDGLARTNGIFVNLKDWFDAFKAVLRDYRSEEPAAPATAAAATRAAKKGVKRSRGAESSSSSSAAAAAAAASSVDPLSDSSLQVRFLSCLATLANLGYIKPTNRRVDHVLKLALQRPY